MRKQKRINAYLDQLKAAGYDPKYEPSDEPVLEDDDIRLSDTVSVQIDSRSGDAIAVTQEGPNFSFWDIEDDEDLIPTVQKVFPLKT